MQLILNLRTKRDVSGQLHATAALPLGKAPPCTQCIGGWVTPGADKDATATRKVHVPARDQPPLSSTYPSHDTNSTLLVNYELKRNE